MSIDDYLLKSYRYVADPYPPTTNAFLKPTIGVLNVELRFLQYDWMVHCG